APGPRRLAIAPRLRRQPGLDARLSLEPAGLAGGRPARARRRGRRALRRRGCLRPRPRPSAGREHRPGAGGRGEASPHRSLAATVAPRLAPAGRRRNRRAAGALSALLGPPPPAAGVGTGGDRPLPLQRAGPLRSGISGRLNGGGRPGGGRRSGSCRLGAPEALAGVPAGVGVADGHRGPLWTTGVSLVPRLARSVSRRPADDAPDDLDGL